MVGAECQKSHVGDTNCGYSADGIVGFRLESELQVGESNWDRFECDGSNRNENNLSNNTMNNPVVVVAGVGCNGDGDRHSMVV